MSPPFEIVSLRDADGGATWLALLLEGVELGQFRFAAPRPASADEMRALIHELAGGFDASRSAIAQFRDLEAARDARRVVHVTPRLAAA